MVPSPLAFNRSPSQAAAGLSLPRNNLKALYQGAVLDVFYKAHILRPSRQAIVCWMSFASFQTAFACLGKGFWGGQMGGRPPQPTSGLSISSPTSFSLHFCKGVGCKDFVPLFFQPHHNLAFCGKDREHQMVFKKKAGGGGNNDLFWLKPNYFDSRSCHGISCKGLSVSSGPSFRIPGAPRRVSSSAQPGAPWLGGLAGPGMGGGCPSR